MPPAPNSTPNAAAQVRREAGGASWRACGAPITPTDLTTEEALALAAAEVSGHGLPLNPAPAPSSIPNPNSDHHLTITLTLTLILNQT